MANASNQDKQDGKVISFPNGETGEGTERTSDPVPKTAELEDTDYAAAKQAYRDREGERMGDRLRAAREATGLSVKDLASALRFKTSFFEALETMYVGQIPKGYLTGILRSYCNALKLPADEIVTKYTSECGAVDVVEDSAVPIAPIPDEGSSGTGMKLALGGMAAALVLALVAWGAVSLFGSDDAPIVVAETGTPSVAIVDANQSLFDEANASGAGANLADFELELIALRPAWLEVRGADGTIFISRVMNEGRSYHPRLGAGWSVTAKDGSAFEWRVGDVTLGHLGVDPSPVYSVSVDAVARSAKEKLEAPVARAPSEGRPTR